MQIDDCNSCIVSKHFLHDTLIWRRALILKILHCDLHLIEHEFTEKKIIENGWKSFFYITHVYFTLRFLKKFFWLILVLFLVKSLFYSIFFLNSWLNCSHIFCFEFWIFGAHIKLTHYTWIAVIKLHVIFKITSEFL